MIKSEWNRLDQKKRLLLLNLGSIENIYILEKISSFFMNEINKFARMTHMRKLGV
jgi:hypothetical protein